jgi:hypothetical protein
MEWLTNTTNVNGQKYYLLGWVVALTEMGSGPFIGNHRGRKLGTFIDQPMLW